MVRLLRRLLSRRSRPGAATPLALYAEAELSGWVSAPPRLAELPPPEAIGKQHVEADGLLARFYRSQQC